VIDDNIQCAVYKKNMLKDLDTAENRSEIP